MLQLPSYDHYMGLSTMYYRNNTLRNINKQPTLKTREYLQERHQDLRNVDPSLVPFADIEAESKLSSFPPYGRDGNASCILTGSAVHSFSICT